MPVGKGKRKVQAVIDEELAVRIQDLAKRLQVSESTCIYMLLDSVVDNEGWLIKLVTTRFGTRIGRLLGISGTDRDRFIEANAELDAEQETRDSKEKSAE